jgi:hypothetical protein
MIGRASLALALVAQAARADVSVGGSARIGAASPDGRLQSAWIAHAAWPRKPVCSRYTRLRVYAETDDQVRAWWWRSIDGSVSVPLVADREAPGPEVLAQLVAVEARSESDQPILSSKVVSFSLECEGGASVGWWCHDAECVTHVVVPFTRDLAVESEESVGSTSTDHERTLRRLLGRLRSDLGAICATGHCSSKIRRIDRAAEALLRRRWTQSFSSFPNPCVDFSDGKNVVQRGCGEWAITISDGDMKAGYMPGIRGTWQPHLEVEPRPRRRGQIHISSGSMRLEGAALEVLP